MSMHQSPVPYCIGGARGGFQAPEPAIARRSKWAMLTPIALLTAWLGGCGTFVPTLTESAAVPEQLASELMVQAIIVSVRCELRNAVTSIVNDDLDSSVIPSNGPRRTYSDFLDNWGAQVALTLTVIERTGVAPNVLLTPATPAAAVLTTAAGLDLSAQATRVEKINLFYTVKDLYLRRGEVCDASGEQRYGSLLVQNDLKIDSGLRSLVNATALRTAAVPAPDSANVISHQVTFQTIVDANVTPTLKLVRATLNPNPVLFGAKRDNTHDLVVTFGPLAKPRGGQSLIAIAEQSHFTSQITSGFRTGFRQ